MKKKVNEERSIQSRMGLTILIFPFASPAIMTPAGKMVNLFSTVSRNTYVIGKELPILIDIDKMRHIEFLKLTSTMTYAQPRNNIIIESIRWVIIYLAVQLEMGFLVFKIRNKIDAILSTTGCYYQIPFLIARIFRKKIYCSSFGIDSDIALTKYGRLASLFITLLCKLNYSLSHIIIVDSPHTSGNRVLKPYKKKIFIGPRYVEDSFKIEIPYQRRDNIIGYVGRISQEKGIIPFMDAIPNILSKRKDVRILLIGSGNIDEQLETKLLDINMPNRINWLRWVDHSEIHNYLNQMRLLIVPSLTEGMPNIILEAMACGTPVLATAVGGIPSLIIDGESGFILRSLLPQDIAKSIDLALSSANCKSIIDQGRRIIEERYSFKVCLQRYQSLLENDQ